MIRVAVYRPDNAPGPGQLSEVVLAAAATGPAELSCAEVTVRDERGGELFNGTDFDFVPAAGGGPLATPQADRQARAFGLCNALYWAQQLVRRVNQHLDRPVPHLLVRVAAHESPARWGGGHYRLPGPASPPEPYALPATGEVHLGSGRSFLPTPTAYFHAPTHNAAIVLHEVGHHICRHTADFRANRLRPAGQQHNGKIALDEGTADFLTALSLGTPDIYGWHRGHLPVTDPRRRRLHGRWTMAHLRPGSGGLAHANGTIWASALWTAQQHSGAGDRFLAMLLRGMARLGAADGAVAEEQFRRTQFRELLRELVAEDTALAPTVLAAMAEHGIGPQDSNIELREQVRVRDRVASADRR